MSMKNHYMHLWGHAKSHFLFTVHCQRSKNQVVHQQVGKRHVDEDREERATTRRVTSVAGLSGRWSEQRLLRSPSHSDYSEAAPRLWTVPVPETGFPHSALFMGGHRGTKGHIEAQIQTQTTKALWCKRSKIPVRHDRHEITYDNLQVH